MAGKIALKTRDIQEWETPKELFDKINHEFHFDLDPCATPQNAKCRLYFSKEDDGLSQDWFGNVFVNPPFKQVGKWVKKAFEEVNKGNAKIVVMLLAARTDTRWFHKYVLPYAEIRFIEGRVTYVGSNNPAPFPSMIVIFEYGKLTRFISRSFCFRGEKR